MNHICPVTPVPAGSASGCPPGPQRDFNGNRFVYTLVSPRARGLSIGVNMNPDKACNFNCCYCDVNRSEPAKESALDIRVMIRELEATLEFALSGRIRERPVYRKLPDALIEVRHVALSGDGEPTICPSFAEVMEAIIHLRSRGKSPFNLALITNATGLRLPAVEEGLRLFSPRDEIWAKLDGGTQPYLTRLNRASDSIETTLANILHIAIQRRITIQSLFPAIQGDGPPASEVEEYARRLKDLKEAGAQIDLVQIYSATRPTHHSECGHLSLRALSAIARRVREVTGLKAEVF